MSRVNQSRRGGETQRQGHREMMPSPRRPVAPSPRRLVSCTLCLRVSVAIPLILFAVACRQDMQDQPKYKPLAPSRFFSDGKSARQLVEGTAPYSPEGKATP